MIRHTGAIDSRGIVDMVRTTVDKIKLDQNKRDDECGKKTERKR